MRTNYLSKMWLTSAITAIAGMSLQAAVPDGGTARIPANPYGSGVYAYSVTNNTDDETGLYSFSLDGKSTHIWSSPFNDSYMFNGWLNDGRICGINMLSGDDRPVLLRYNEYDFDTGEVLASRTLDASNLMNYFKYCVYIPEKNRIFGVGVDERNWSCIKYMDMDNFLNSESDPEVVIVKNINYTQYLVSICYNPVDKNVYGIDESNNMVRINQETGDYETLLTIPGNKLSEGRPQGCVYLPNKDEYLLAGMWRGDLSSHLYRIDIAEKKVIEVGPVDKEPFITFMVNAAEVDGSVPARPRYVSMSYPDGSLSGNITYTMPETLADGSAAPQNMTWTLLIDGVAAESGNAGAGETVVVNATLGQGSHFLEMMASNNGHEGPSAKNDVFVGYDKPKAPANVVLKEGIVTWEAVTEGVNGGYIDTRNLVYDVYINDEFIDETSATEITFTVPEGDSFSRHIAEVRAVNHGIESESGVSAPALYGKPMKLDVHFDCTSAADAEFFSTSGKGEYYPAWGFSYSEGAFATSTAYYGGDAWLVTPPIDFDDADGLYSLSFSLKEESNWDQSPKFATYLVSPDDQMTPLATICGSYEYPEKFQWGTVDNVFSVPAAGTYCVVFVSTQTGSGNSSMIKNVDIKRSTKSVVAPDLPETFKAVAADGGALRAIVQFSMPVKNVAGGEIDADTEITATVKCGENTVSTTGLPGSAQSVEVATVQGDNEITATFAIGDAVGMSCSTTVFTGKDVPSAPSNVVAMVSSDNRTTTFRWDAPTTGANGHYFNAEGIKYVLKTKAGWSWSDIATVDDGSTEVTVSLPEYDYLNLVNVRIVASNEIGDGGMTSVNVQVGKPYALPMNEDFKDVAYYTYGPVYLETPTPEYSYALLYFYPPYQLNDSFADKTEHTSIAVFPGAAGESRSLLALPKFSTLTEESGKTVRMSFEVYAGDIMADDITFYAVTHDVEEPVVLGKVEPAGGWTTVNFELPSDFMNRNWVNVMVDSHYPKDGTYTVIYGYKYELDYAVGVEGITEGSSNISASGNYVYFNNLGGNEYAVYTLDGKLVKSGTVDCDRYAVGLEAGIYVAKAGTSTAKVIVR